ncbi:MAG: hypothetical protein QW117_00505 [Candidatus Pacearchaeota archaeon]
MENKLSQYTREEFESFAKGIKKIIDIVKSKKPTYIFAPLIGSIPLVDLMCIADRHFPSEILEYPPNSSRFKDREKILDKWYRNFLKYNYNGEKIKIVCIDEVVSGSSAVKGYNQFKKSLFDYGKEIKERLDKKIDYEIVGIGEFPTDNKRNPAFKRLIRDKKANVIEVKRIITSDNIYFNPIRFEIEKIKESGRYIFKPKIERFEFSEEYLNLMREFAEYCGVDPNSIKIKNTLKIKESLEKYLE